MGNGIAASLVEMTVDGHTEEFWIRRSPTLEPVFQRVSFPSGDYEVAYDVDRKAAGFELKLDDFDVGFDPGTEQASSFVSQVRLTDEAQGIKDQPHTISMNEPLDHRGYTFYQSSYIRHVDPQTLREDRPVPVGLPGRRPTPAGSIKYAGLPAGRARRVRPVLHAGGPLHRRRQARARAGRGQGPQGGRRRRRPTPGDDRGRSSTSPKRHSEIATTRTRPRRGSSSQGDAR